jgi:hypothetical protein
MVEIRVMPEMPVIKEPEVREELITEYNRRNFTFL